MADFLNSKTGLRNRFVLGPMQAVRANTSISYEYDPMTGDPIEVIIPGSVSCLTEVMADMFEEDDAGVSFGDVYWVRTRCWRQPIADGGGDMDWWTAVSKELPSGYTLVPRYGGTYSLMTGFYADYIGSDPMGGFSWNLRTAAGVLWDESDPEESERARWSPMNLNQEVVDSTPVFAYMGDVPGYGDFYLAALAEDHIGFRGGLATLTNAQLTTKSGTMEIWGHPVTGNYVDDAVQVGSVSLSCPASSTAEVSMPEILPTSDGIRWNFYGKISPADYTSQLQLVSKVFQLSPRVDVPLFYCASMGNRVAPGGIILP